MIRFSGGKLKNQKKKQKKKRKVNKVLQTGERAVSNLKVVKNRMFVAVVVMRYFYR